MLPTQNLNVKAAVRLATPRALKAELPVSEAANRTVVTGRQRVTRILTQQDPRFLVVIGPCSIHDPEGALEYGRRLSVLRRELAGQLEIVMRVYFEKPRTTIGWKGLINDPHLDGSYDIEAGVRTARKLLISLAEMGLPAATEFLDPIIPQYIDDLVSWAAVGAPRRNRRPIARWRAASPCPWGSRTGRMADCKSRWTRWCRRARATVSSG